MRRNAEDIPDGCTVSVSYTHLEKHAYTTWLATETYTFDKEEVTVAEVFAAALEEAGLTYEGLEENYIRSITAPSACGDYRLAEKENGLYSGWMYTVNGFHPGDGVQDLSLIHI